MIVKVLASGSKGNCTYIECNNKKILIDVGISYLQIKNSLDTISVNINDIDIVLLTHSHNDHIKGLASFLKKTNAYLCTPMNVYEDICKKVQIDNYMLIDDEVFIDNINISAIHLSHDVECYGYIIEHDNKSIVYITDTGYVNRKLFDKILNKDIYIFESNYDEKMLMNGPYPYILKQRILSDKGHLSNKESGRLLSNVIGTKTKYVFLAHISEHNNLKELALSQVRSELKNHSIDFNGLILTDQYVSLDEVVI